MTKPSTTSIIGLATLIGVACVAGFAASQRLAVKIANVRAIMALQRDIQAFQDQQRSLRQAEWVATHTASVADMKDILRRLRLDDEKPGTGHLRGGVPWTPSPNDWGIDPSFGTPLEAWRGEGNLSST